MKLKGLLLNDFYTLKDQYLSYIKILVPCMEEQKKIADYFSELDKIIDAEEKILDDLRLMKKGLLQKLFL